MTNCKENLMQNFISIISKNWSCREEFRMRHFLKSKFKKRVGLIKGQGGFFSIPNKRVGSNKSG